MNAQELKKYTQQNKLTNRALARLLDVEEAQISRWLSGKNEISRAWRALIDQKLSKKRA